MARNNISEERKAQVLEAIQSHILLVGPSKWGELQEKFKDVSRATFFRLINQARQQMEASATLQGPAALKIAQKRISARVETPEKTQARIKAQLPTAPSPAIIADLGPKADEVFNFMAYFHQIVGDADLVRSSLITTNEDGTVKVKNPVLMDKSIARRLNIIESWLHSQQLVYNLERIQELYKIVMDAVGEADPDTQRAILSRLREANKQRGLTSGMGA